MKSATQGTCSRAERPLQCFGISTYETLAPDVSRSPINYPKPLIAAAKAHPGAVMAPPGAGRAAPNASAGGQTRNHHAVRRASSVRPNATGPPECHKPPLMNVAGPMPASCRATIPAISKDSSDKGPRAGALRLFPSSRPNWKHPARMAAPCFQAFPVPRRQVPGSLLRRNAPWPASRWWKRGKGGEGTCKKVSLVSSKSTGLHRLTPPTRSRPAPCLTALTRWNAHHRARAPISSGGKLRGIFGRGNMKPIALKRRASSRLAPSLNPSPTRTFRHRALVELGPVVT